MDFDWLSFFPLTGEGGGDTDLTLEETLTAILGLLHFIVGYLAVYPLLMLIDRLSR